MAIGYGTIYRNNGNYFILKITITYTFKRIIYFYKLFF